MEVVFLLVLPAALWAHAWYMLGLYTNPRTLGILAAAAGIILISMVVLNPPTVLASAGGLGTGGSAEAALTVLVAVWGIYSLAVAGVALWGFDERTVGFYSLFLWVISLLFVGYYFLGGELFSGTGGANMISPIMGIASLLLSVLAALSFFYLAPPFARMRQATGWFQLVISIVIALLGGLFVLGLSVS